MQGSQLTPLRKCSFFVVDAGPQETFKMLRDCVWCWHSAIYTGYMGLSVLPFPPDQSQYEIIHIDQQCQMHYSGLPTDQETMAFGEQTL